MRLETHGLIVKCLLSKELSQRQILPFHWPVKDAIRIWLHPCASPSRNLACGFYGLSAGGGSATTSTGNDVWVVFCAWCCNHWWFLPSLMVVSGVLTLPTPSITSPCSRCSSVSLAPARWLFFNDLHVSLVSNMTVQCTTIFLLSHNSLFTDAGW